MPAPYVLFIDASTEDGLTPCSSISGSNAHIGIRQKENTTQLPISSSIKAVFPNDFWYIHQAHLSTLIYSKIRKHSLFVLHSIPPPFKSTIMSWRYEHSGSERPETNWAFMVVAKHKVMYCPVSVITETPTKDKDWTWVSKLWVADTALHMYEFLTKKDVASRCKLEADLESAIQKNRQERLWFRYEDTDIQGKPELVTEKERTDKLRDVASICHPYTTLGMKDCIFRKVPSGNGNETLFEESARWAQDSLKSTFADSSKFSLVVFDITLLNNVAVGVIDRAPNGERRLATMAQHCQDEIDRFKDDYRPVMEAFTKLPYIVDQEILQLLWKTEDLNNWVRAKLGCGRYTVQAEGRMSAELERARSSAILWSSSLYDLSMADSTVLTMRELIEKLVEIQKTVLKKHVERFFK